MLSWPASVGRTPALADAGAKKRKGSTRGQKTGPACQADTGTDKAHANGTTTDAGGAVSTNESYGDTATDQFTDGFSQTSSGSYNGASGSGRWQSLQFDL